MSTSDLFLGIDRPAYVRQLPDGREGVVAPLTYGRARIGVGFSTSTHGFDDTW